MSYIDVAIPAIVGLMLLLSPQSFLAKSGTPDQKRIRLLRNSGIVLLLVAALYLTIKVLG